MINNMWLFVKKYFVTFLVLVSIALVIKPMYYLLFFIFAPGMCGNHVIESHVSPSHKWQLVLFQRDCGAISGFSSQISLLNVDENISSDFGKGNIYIANGYPKGFSIKWKSNKSVSIITPFKENFKMKKSLKGITFSYKYQELKQANIVKIPNKTEQQKSVSPADI